MIPRRLLSIRFPFPRNEYQRCQHAPQTNTNEWDFCPEGGTTSLMVGVNSSSRPFRPHAMRLAIVDDHEVFRIGLRSLFERLGEIDVVWDTGSAYDAWRRIAVEPVDAVLMDVNLGGPIDGLEASRALTARDPDLKVVLISGLVDEQRLAEARSAGAAGFLPKDLPAADMVTALLDLVQT